MKIPERDKDRHTRSIETTVMYLRLLVNAKSELLGCYRCGKRPTDKLLATLDALNEMDGLMSDDEATQ